MVGRARAELRAALSYAYTGRLVEHEVGRIDGLLTAIVALDEGAEPDVELAQAAAQVHYSAVAANEPCGCGMTKRCAVDGTGLFELGATLANADTPLNIGDRSWWADVDLRDDEERRADERARREREAAARKASKEEARKALAQLLLDGLLAGPPDGMTLAALDADIGVHHRTVERVLRDLERKGSVEVSDLWYSDQRQRWMVR